MVLGAGPSPGAKTSAPRRGWLGGQTRYKVSETGNWRALSRLLVCCAKMYGVAMFHAAAVMASHLFIASVRNWRNVLREIRWR